MSPYIEQAVARCELPIEVRYAWDNVFDIVWHSPAHGMQWRAWGHPDNAKDTYLNAVNELGGM